MLLFADVWQGLRYGSTIPVRMTLMLAAAIWAVTILFSSGPSHSLMFAAMPRTSWSAVYGLDAAILFWRMVDPKSHPMISRITLAATAALWAVNVADSIASLGHLGAGHAAEVSLAVSAFWATLRTDLTHTDKLTA